MSFHEIDNLEMTSVEASENPLAFALQQAIPDSEVVIDVEDILIAIEDDLVGYKSNVPLTKWTKIFNHCLGGIIYLSFELSPKNKLNFKRLAIRKNS